MRSLPFLFVALAAIEGCDGDTALTVEADCNPLGATGCLTPWPSSSLATVGVAPTTPITIELEAAIDPASLALPGATVLLDLVSGQRVPHVSALEARPGAQAIRIVPSEPLAHGHRYAVAITNAVVDLEGEALESPPGFSALIDDRYTDHERLEAMRPRFAGTLDALEDAGLDLDALVVAWDFATR
jgi:hypothetical protein